MANTSRECAEMRGVYGFYNRNAQAAPTKYETFFPGQNRYPNQTVFRNVHQCYLEDIIPG